MLVAQNPGGGAISAQEFATARQDLQNLLRNPGYVPEQVAAINDQYERDVKQLKPGETVPCKALTGKDRFTSTRATTIANGEVYDSLRNKN